MASRQAFDTEAFPDHGWWRAGRFRPTAQALRLSVRAPVRRDLLLQSRRGSASRLSSVSKAKQGTVGGFAVPPHPSSARAALAATGPYCFRPRASTETTGTNEVTLKAHDPGDALRPTPSWRRAIMACPAVRRKQAHMGTDRASAKKKKEKSCSNSSEKRRRPCLVLLAQVGHEAGCLLVMTGPIARK